MQFRNSCQTNSVRSTADLSACRLLLHIRPPRDSKRTSNMMRMLSQDKSLQLGPGTILAVQMRKRCGDCLFPKVQVATWLQ